MGEMERYLNGKDNQVIREEKRGIFDLMNIIEKGLKSK
jgi:hypothetical protein